MSGFRTYKYLIILFSLYAYSFSFSNNAWIGYLVFYIIPIIYILLNLNTVINLFFNASGNKTTLCLNILLILIILSIIGPLLSGTNDYTYLYVVTYILRKLIPYTFLVVCLVNKYGEEASIEIFMYYFCLATICYVSVTCIFLALPSLKEFWLSFVTTERQADLLEASYGYSTRIGWAGFSGYRLTMKCSIAVAFSMYLYLNEATVYRMKLSCFICSIGAALVGNFFYGRTGIIASSVSILVLLVMCGRIRISRILQILGIILAALSLAYLLSFANEQLRQWYVWMSTPFINLFKTGSFDNYSVNTMLGRMLFTPSIQTMIMGDWIYTTSTGYYLSTDLGFMRSILFWGLGGTILAYIMTYLSISSLGRKKAALH